MPKELKKSDKQFLNVTIDGTEYTIPLSRSLKLKELRSLKNIMKTEDQFDQLDLMGEFFSSYIGADVVDNLDSEEIAELANLWKQANEEIGEVDLGES